MRRTLLAIAILLNFVCAVPSGADVIELKDGGEKFDGKITNDNGDNITIKLKTGGTATFPKSWVKKIRKEEVSDKDLYTKQDQYFEKLSKIDQKSAEANLTLAKWCHDNATAENGLLEMADRHYRMAKELDPKLAERAGKELAEVQNKEAERLYKIAETEYGYGEYFASERMIRSILTLYPDSSFAQKARDLLSKIWGPQKAAAILNQNDGLPEIVFTPEGLRSVMASLNSKEKIDAYFMKCINTGMDYEERAKDVDREKKTGYYSTAINCYNVVLGSEDDNAKKLSETKMRDCLKKFFETQPEPFSDLKHSEITNFLTRVQDALLVEKVSKQYLKTGDELLKKAKKLKQPEKGEKARTAYFCYSIADNFSKDEKVKQEAFARMVECQRLERAVR